MTNTLPFIAKHELEDLIRRIILATKIEFTLGEEVDPFHPIVYFKITADKPFHPEINGCFNDKRYFQYASIKGNMLAKSIGKALSEPPLVRMFGEKKLVQLHTQFVDKAHGRSIHADWKELLTTANNNPVVFEKTATIGYLMAIHAALMKASRIRLINQSLDIRSYLEKTEALIRKKYELLYFHHYGKINGYWRKIKGALNGINRSIGPF
nr:MAG TPA: hypothetical protein [Caudoviricetes sp.]